MAKTIILGMCDPYTDEDPSHALSTAVGNASGRRLWSIMNDFALLSPKEYEDAFERRNLLPGTEWDQDQANRVGLNFFKSVNGRRVIILGASVSEALRIKKFSSDLYYGNWMSREGFGWSVVYAVIPHPSGLTRSYNIYAFRQRIGHFLHQERVRYLLEKENGG